MRTPFMVGHPSFRIITEADVDVQAVRTLQHIDITHVLITKMVRGTPSSEVTGLDCRVP